MQQHRSTDYMVRACTLLKISGILLLCMLLFACSGKDHHLQEIEQYVAEVKNRPPSPVEPIPKFQGYQAFQYSAASMRSPFVAPQRKTTSSSLQPDVNRTKDELEAFPIDGLKMVGTISKDNKIWALILAPDKVVYRVTIGSYLGQNYGKIVSIGKDKIDIIETVPDDLGGWKKRNATLTLSQ